MWAGFGCCSAPGSTRGDKVVRRELCSVITKGTQTLGALISGEMTGVESNFLLAICEKVRCIAVYFCSSNFSCLLISEAFDQSTRRFCCWRLFHRYLYRLLPCELLYQYIQCAYTV